MEANQIRSNEKSDIPGKLKTECGGDNNFELVEHHEASSYYSRNVNDNFEETFDGEDEAMYARLLEMLQRQIKKAQAYAKQATHASKTADAERFNELTSTTQGDHDYVLNCFEHGDSPPRFYFENQVFDMVKMNPDIGSDELELTIVQCIDLRGTTSDNIIVEWEMPFPQDAPIKGCTKQSSGSQQNPKFPAAIFRVPFRRKLKSSQRAIQKKAIKLNIIQKGGFLQSDKSIGATSIKLHPLDEQCELHAVEELKARRDVVGKIEVYVKIRTPFLESGTQVIEERWVFVEHSRNTASTSRSNKPAPVPRRSDKPNKSSRICTLL